MSQQKENDDRLPVIYIQMRGGQVRYGQQIKKGGSKPSVIQISQRGSVKLINSRIRRRTFSLFIRVLALFIPSITIPFTYMLDSVLDSKLLATNVALSVAAAVIGLLIAQVVKALETRARTTTLIYKLNSTSKESFRQFHTALTQLINSEFIWSVHSKKATDDWKRQAGASSLVERKVVEKKQPPPPFLKTVFKVIGIPYSWHTKLFFFPDRLYLYEYGEYSLVNYNDCKVVANSSRFIEEDKVPTDARQVDQTWRYVRRDGLPDKRFSNNRQLPIMEYCLVTLTLK